MLAGLTDADLSKHARHEFLTREIRRELLAIPAADSPARTLGTSKHPSLNAIAKVEAQVLTRIAIEFSVRALGLHAATEVPRLTQINFGPQRTAFHRAMAEMTKVHGPLALALVHQIFDVEWMKEGSTLNAFASKGRGAFVQALRTLTDPSLIAQLVVAAAGQDNAAMAGICKRLLDTMPNDCSETNKRSLDATLKRLRGEHLTYVGFRNAPPARLITQWLASKAVPPVGQAAE